MGSVFELKKPKKKFYQEHEQTTGDQQIDESTMAA
jgi:hypothetical protein